MLIMRLRYIAFPAIWSWSIILARTALANRTLDGLFSHVTFDEKQYLLTKINRSDYTLDGFRTDWLLSQHMCGLKIYNNGTTHGSAIISRFRMSDLIEETVKSHSQLTLEIWLRPDNVQNRNTMTEIFSIGAGIPFSCSNSLLSLKQGEFGRLRIDTASSVADCHQHVVHGFELDESDPETIYQMTFSINDTTVTMYINYVEPRSLSTTFYRRDFSVNIPDRMSFNSSHTLRFAAHNRGDLPWQGELFQVSLYNRTLNASEIKENFAEFIPPVAFPNAKKDVVISEDQEVQISFDGLSYINKNVNIEILSLPLRGTLMESDTGQTIKSLDERYTLAVGQRLISYIPEQDDSSTDSASAFVEYATLLYKVLDGSPVEVIGSIHISVVAVNDAPARLESSFSFLAIPMEYFLITVPVYDVDDSTAALSIKIRDVPLNGSIYEWDPERYDRIGSHLISGDIISANDSNGVSLWYKFESSFTGNFSIVAAVDVIEMEVIDPKGQTSLPGFASITLRNSLIANPANISTGEGIAVEVHLLASYVMQQEIDLFLLSLPIGGILYSQSDGGKIRVIERSIVTFPYSLVNDERNALFYRPDPNLVSDCQTIPCLDSFEFAARSGWLWSAPALVHLYVEDVNDSPVIVAPESYQVVTLRRTWLEGIKIMDIDPAIYHLIVEVSVINGSAAYLELDPSASENVSFLIGDGQDDITSKFEGTLTDINTALGSLSFHDISGNVGHTWTKIIVWDGDLPPVSKDILIDVSRHSFGQSDEDCSKLYAILPVCSSSVPSVLRVLLLLFLGLLIALLIYKAWWRVRLHLRLRKYQKRVRKRSKVKQCTGGKSAASPLSVEETLDRLEEFLMQPSMVGPLMIFTSVRGSVRKRTLGYLLMLLDINERSERFVKSVIYSKLQRYSTVSDLCEDHELRELLGIYCLQVGKSWAAEVVSNFLEKLEYTPVEQTTGCAYEQACELVHSIKMNLWTLPTPIFDLATYLQSRIAARGQLEGHANRSLTWLLVEIYIGEMITDYASRCTKENQTGACLLIATVAALEEHISESVLLLTSTDESLERELKALEYVISHLTLQDCDSRDRTDPSKKLEALRALHPFVADNFDDEKQRVALKKLDVVVDTCPASIRKVAAEEEKLKSHSRHAANTVEVSDVLPTLADSNHEISGFKAISAEAERIGELLEKSNVP